MPDDSPFFSAKPLEEPAEAKSAPKKIVRKKRADKTSFADSPKKTQIAKRLTQIYQDDRGRLPDMRNIKIKKHHPVLKFFTTLLILGAFLAAAAWAGFLLMPSNKKFSENQVVLNINGPKTFTAGSTTTYKIVYGNEQNLTLKNATLNLQYPKGFVFLSSEPEAQNVGHTEWTLGEISPYKKREVIITGLTYGSLDQKQSWRAFLTYQPENFSSELQKAAVLDVTAAQSPFTLTMQGPDKITTGNNAEYIFTVKKENDSALNKLILKPSWPQNFFIVSSTPTLNKDMAWLIYPNKDTSTVWLEQKFKMVGKFSAPATSSATQGEPNADTVRKISALLSTPVNNNTYELATASLTTTLAQNNLGFSLAINGSLGRFNTQPGENLHITIALKNESLDTLKNAVIKLILDAPAAKKQSLLDWAKLNDVYDGDVRGIQITDTLRRGEITWNKTHLTDLALINKNQEINFNLKLPIKTNEMINFADLATSSQIIAWAEINFTDQTNTKRSFATNQIIIAVNSDLKLETRDTVSAEGDSQEHQINWLLTNNFHPLKNLIVSAEIYGNAQTTVTTPPAGKAELDPAGKKLTWAIAEMPVETDVLALPFTITLSNPNPTQEVLISKVHVQAEDAVTGERLDFMGEETRLR